MLPQANAYANHPRRAAAAGDATRLATMSEKPGHRLSQERRHAGRGCGEGERCLDANNQLFDRRRDVVSLDEVERIAI